LGAALPGRPFNVERCVEETLNLAHRDQLRAEGVRRSELSAFEQSPNADVADAENLGGFVEVIGEPG